MKLYSLKIEGFRRHVCTEIHFLDATFLIGQNNIGKSSVLQALNYVLNDIKKIPDEEFFHISSESGTENIRLADKVVLTAEFRNVPEEAKFWRGFKGRILSYELPLDSYETGNRIVYRKTFEPRKDYVVEMRELKRTIKPEFQSCSNLNELIHAGLDEEIVDQLFSGADRAKKLLKKQTEILEELDEMYDFNEAEEDWFINPGGIPSIVLQKLPKFLLIPAQDKTEELSGSKGTLVTTLEELFKDVREASHNYQQAQHYLNQLALELDPSDQDSEFGGMMGELNSVLGEVFPDSKINAQAKLSDADSVIKPQFNITMSSNITTPVSLQGTGMIRSAVFALLRYRNIRDNKKNSSESSPIRPLLIGFEEPEIYLHPNAAKQMRDTIYELAQQNQIVCTTHSPYMIDLSKRPMQILNNLTVDKVKMAYEAETIEVDKIHSYPLNTTNAYKKLEEDDKVYVKMLLKIDDYMAKVFFSKQVLIVEGDTEDIVLRETINRMPEKVRKDIYHNWQIVKARGKGSITSLVKYLKAMGIQPYAMHDKDTGKPNAEMHNQPILDAVGGPDKRIMLENCIEDVLGYPAPSSEKPFRAYRFSSQWGQSWTDVPEPWRKIMEGIFEESFKLQQEESIVTT
ncbi:AAA family ATPase [Tumebacillus sp. ITR2]|uniref:AAA family ATPase n=1 Tax=Tumebacillus amylolyticus TaxID=2801339 RepID=A0ABS1JCM5_9BACL|nr:AAA family ATPase [Tumebacillus amylolyticus]MBL0388021.1 AAA family ATPase [Tumebacillus amylolyticus]